MPNVVTRVLLLRHAETAVPDVFHGAESDVGLSPRGARQVAALAPFLAAEKPAVVISSEMRRAVATALPIARACGLPLHIEADLHERRVGVLSGQTWKSPLWEETLQRWMAGETSFAPPGAESYDQIRERVQPVLVRLTERFTGKTLVFIVHGVVIKVLVTSLGAGLGPKDWNAFRSINLAINELTYAADRWSIVRLADLPEAIRLVE